MKVWIILGLMTAAVLYLDHRDTQAQERGEAKVLAEVSQVQAKRLAQSADATGELERRLETITVQSREDLRAAKEENRTLRAQHDARAAAANCLDACYRWP